MANGHQNVFDYTPRRLSAFVQLAEKRRNKELLELFSIARTAYHGEKKECRKLMKELQKHG